MWTSQTEFTHFAVTRERTLVLSLVVVAGLIRYACPVCVSVDSQMIASVTGARPPAVNHVLDRQIGGRPRPSSLDVDAVWMREGSTRLIESLFDGPSAGEMLVSKLSLRHRSCTKSCQTNND